MWYLTTFSRPLSEMYLLHHPLERQAFQNWQFSPVDYISTQSDRYWFLILHAVSWLRLLFETDCNTVVTGFSGVIESPNFPSQYSDGLDCTWNITAPRGNKINATFSHFQLEVTYWLWGPRLMINNCSQDYVEVWFSWACKHILAI